MVSVSTGIQPEFIGKPEPIIMSKSLDILGLEKSEVAMVGDLYDTDIMSGINVGIDTIHVQTGVSTYEDIQSKEIPPTYSFKDFKCSYCRIRKNKISSICFEINRGVHMNKILVTRQIPQHYVEQLKK